MKIIIYSFLFFLCYASYSQSLILYDINLDLYPTIKAKFYAIDENGNQILNITPSDIEIFEDGIKRDVTNISCPTPKPIQALSSVLVMDASGSMEGKNIDLAKEAARSWILALPNTKSECAITAFDSKNYFIQDFTNNKDLLLEKVNTLFARGGTDYNAALISPTAGGLIVSKDGFYKKVIVLLTDGFAPVPEIDKIIEEAKKQECIIYAVTLVMNCPSSLKKISIETGGMWFENVTSIDEARNVYIKILNFAQGGEPCTIEWQAPKYCEDSNINVETKLLKNGTNYSTSYYLPKIYVSKLEFNPLGVHFSNKEIGIEHDTTITVTAVESAFNVLNITASESIFKLNPTSFYLNEGESKNLTLSFIPQDSSYIYVDFEFETETCNKKFYASHSYEGMRPTKKTLKLTHPNGGEVFVVGSDTVITWEGISPLDTCLIEYSTNSGQSWKLLSDNASGLNYSWLNLPRPQSDDCLVKIKQIAYNSKYIPEIEWEKSYGGWADDYSFSILELDMGYIFAGMTSSTNGDVTSINGSGDFWIVRINNYGQIIWQKNYGGKNWDIPYDIKQSNDGGYIVVGSTLSNTGDVTINKGGTDIWVIKLDILGNLQWQKTYGGSKDDLAYSVILADDDSYVIAGFTESSDGDISEHKGKKDIWVLKINHLGNILWEKTFGGTNDEEATSVIQALDGGYLVGGWTNSNDGDVYYNNGSTDYWILKLDPNGDLEWEKTFGGTNNDFVNSIALAENGFIIAGKTTSNNNDVKELKGIGCFWILKIDYNGKIVWQKSYGGSYWDIPNSIQKTSDGGFIIVGTSESTNGDITENKGKTDVWIVKINNQGRLLWQKSIGGSSSDIAHSILETIDNGYILTGWTYSNDDDVSVLKGNRDIWVVKLSPDRFILQEDISDNVFSIVEPLASARDIDMLQVLISDVKDSLVSDFIINSGAWRFRVDSLYFQGIDADAFSLVSGFPKYIVDEHSSYFAEFRFIPQKLGIHNAEIVIITQADTLIQNIRGEGVAPKLQILNDIIDFGSIYVGQYRDSLQAVTLKNIGSAPLKISTIKIAGPNIDDFSILSGNLSFSLNPGDTCKIDLRFTARFIGRTSGSLEFHSEGMISPAIVHLFGEGLYIGETIIELKVLNTEGEPSEIINVPIILSDEENLIFSGISNVNLELSYNSTMLYPINRIAQSIDDIKSKITLHNLSLNNSIGDTIALLKFRVGLGNAEQCVLELNNIETIGGEAEISIINGKFTLLGVCYDGGARLLNPNSKAGFINITPNPAENLLQIDFSLIEKGYSEVIIINYLGETVKTVFSKEVQEFGNKSEIVNLSDLATGQYVIIMKTPTIYESRNISVIK